MFSQVKIDVVPLFGKFWSINQDGPKIYSHSVASRGPDRRRSCFPYMLFSISCERANSSHRTYVWIFSFMAFFCWHYPASTQDDHTARREDLNLRPLAPHASALAGLRHALNSRHTVTKIGGCKRTYFQRERDGRQGNECS